MKLQKALKHQTPTTMLFKTLKNDRKKVMIFRQPSKSGPNQYEFFIVVSEINHLGKFVINDNYKQKQPITTAKNALRTAEEFLKD